MLAPNEDVVWLVVPNPPAPKRVPPPVDVPGPKAGLFWPNRLPPVPLGPKPALLEVAPNPPKAGADVDVVFPNKPVDVPDGWPKAGFEPKRDPLCWVFVPNPVLDKVSNCQGIFPGRPLGGPVRCMIQTSSLVSRATRTTKRVQAKLIARGNRQSKRGPTTEQESPARVDKLIEHTSAA